MTKKTFTLFGVPHTRHICPSCLRGKDFMRRETIMPLPPGAMAPVSVLRGLGHICFDCGAAETLRRSAPELSWSMARIVIGNDRQEKLRLPGTMFGLSFVRASQPGDLDRLHAWLDEVLPEELLEQ